MLTLFLQRMKVILIIKLYSMEVEEISYPVMIIVKHSAEKFHQSVKKLIILPHTIYGPYRIIIAVCANVDIFCREYYSYHYVQQYAKQAQVYLSPDLALT